MKAVISKKTTTIWRKIKDIKAEDRRKLTLILSV